MISGNAQYARRLMIALGVLTLMFCVPQHIAFGGTAAIFERLEVDRRAYIKTIPCDPARDYDASFYDQDGDGMFDLSRNGDVNLHPIYGGVSWGPGQLPAALDGNNDGLIDSDQGIDDPSKKSCLGGQNAQNIAGGNEVALGEPITLDNYAIEVCVDQALNFPVSGIGYLAGNKCDEKCGWVHVGESDRFLRPLVCGNPARKDVDVTLKGGGKACVTTQAAFVTRYVQANDDLLGEKTELGVYEDRHPALVTVDGEPHCALLPPPRIDIADPDWPDIIAPSCYRQCDTEGVNCGGAVFPKSFVSKVAHCVESTVWRVFHYEYLDGGTKSAFESVRELALPIVLSLVTLYIVIVGYEILLGNMNYFRDMGYAFFTLFKPVLVLVMAYYNIIYLVYPALPDAGKSLGMLLLDADSYTSVIPDAQIQAITDTYDAAVNEFNQAKADEQAVLDNPDSTLADRQAARAAIEALPQRQDMIDATIPYREALESQNRVFSQNTVDEVGAPFRYCNSTSAVRVARLWDELGCRFNRYIGIGYVEGSENSPMLFVIIASTIMFSTLLFFLIGLSVILMIVLLLTMVKVLELYLISFIAVSILVFVSPVFVPTILFKFTKGAFDAWARQLIGYSLLPIIVLAFVALMFGIYDRVFYGDNIAFDSQTNTILLDSDDDGVGDSTTTGECVDKRTLSCVYKTYTPVKIKALGKVLGSAFTFYIPNLKDITLYPILIAELLKMIFLSYIILSGLNTVDSMRASLTNTSAPPGFAPSPKASMVYGGLKAVTGNAVSNIKKAPGKARNAASAGRQVGRWAGAGSGAGALAVPGLLSFKAGKRALRGLGSAFKVARKTLNS